MSLPDESQRIRHTWQSMDEARALVRASLGEHRDLINAVGQAWYRAPWTYSSVHVFGTNCMKTPGDLWVYHDLIGRIRPQTILETGTAGGGSALWFALCLDGWQRADSARVVTIDIETHTNRPVHPRIAYVEGDSGDVALIHSIMADSPGPRLVSLDADHRASHVARELAAVEPYLQSGDYLVVEDTCVLTVGGEPGPLAAVRAFCEAHPEWVADPWCERFWITFAPGAWLVRTA